MNKNIISGVVVLAFAVVYTVMAFRLPPPASGSVVIGPSVFPGAIGILLIVTSVILVISGFLERRQDKAKQAAKDGSKEEGEPQDKKKVFLLSLFLLGYVVLFVPLGYLISTALFILSVTMYLDRKAWIRNVIYSLAFPITVYFVFDRVLSVYLPLGPLG
ncbi:putative tricarboxylic transport membrane protein [Bacillus oleivorans]|uniref:Putative tricarboxylic transport membrane protein n=1 Tax=Bacillus oleivorans TaxID=1448271 RepID=A0A285CPU2_9BACI|nr:tripartite tricarboxylate transporter TctB family protein [Bacillus oleivorans]SNX69579.1 putative tricarboxylic transport membrane protein [Bacillus oleivorans]